MGVGYPGKNSGHAEKPVSTTRGIRKTNVQKTRGKLRKRRHGRKRGHIRIECTGTGGLWFESATACGYWERVHARRWGLRLGVDSGP